MIRLAILLVLVAAFSAAPVAPDLAARGRYGPDGSFSIGRHVISPRIARVDPRSFRLHPRPDPAPNGMPGPLASPSHGSIDSRPYGIGYFFLDASQRRRGPAEDLE
jgi:hypothetical protein